MSDIRRTILWVIFGFSMVLLWDKWQIHNGKPATFFPSATPAAAPEPQRGASAGPSAGHGSVPSASSQAAAPGTVPGAAPVPTQGTEPQVHERVTVDTDVYRLQFDSEGGTLIFAELRKYADTADKAKGFVLFDQSPTRVYLPQSGLIGGAGAGGLPTHKTSMKLMPGPRTLQDGQNTLSIRFESPDLGGIKLVKTWTLKRGAYDMVVRHEVVNTGSTPVAPQLYLQLVRDGNKPPGESSFYSTFTGPAIYTEAKKYHKIEFKDIEAGKIDIDKSATNGYVAMVQHYFASAWLLPQGAQREFFVRKVDSNLYSVGMLAPWARSLPGRAKPSRRACLPARKSKKPSKRSRLVWSWSRTMAGSPFLPSRCIGCSTTCTSCSATGAGPSWRWWCCSSSRFTGSTPRPTRAWPR